MGKRKNKNTPVQVPAGSKPEQNPPNSVPQQLKKKQKEKPSGQKYASGAVSLAFPQSVTAAWVFLMFTLFPLVFQDYYFNILEAKTKTFYFLINSMIILMTGWGLVSGVFLRELQKE